MYRIESKLDLKSPEYLNNKALFMEILEQYRENMRHIRQAAPAQAILKHKERGKLLARERIDLLVDANTPFWNFQPWPHTMCMAISFLRLALLPE